MKLVVFDLDGTLLNTVEDIRGAVNYALHAFDLPTVTSSEKMMTMIGHGLRNALSQAVAESRRTVEAQDMGLMYELLMAYYAKHPADKTVPYEGIPELLEGLEKQGIALAILSNKRDELVQTIVKTSLPKNHFLFVLGQTDRYPLKPDPTSLNDLLAKNGIEKKDVLYVGDSEVDRKTADNAGLSSLIVSYGFRSRTQLEASGISDCLESVEALGESLGV